MPQDIKNFYNLTDIDTSAQLKVEILLHCHDTAEYRFTVNKQISTESSIFYFDLLDSLYFNCSVTRGAVEVVKIAINGYEIMPVYLHLAEPKTNWITDNWTLSVPGPFYPWYYEITGQGWVA